MTLSYDLVVVGGSLGGCAAAIAAGDAGLSVCLLESSDWIGGQYSSQGVTKPDENRYIEDVGSTARYRAFRHAVRAFYRDNYKLSATGTAQPTFNPGGSYPGFAVEPRVAHSVLLRLLQASPKVHVRLQNAVRSASVAGDRVASVDATDAHGVTTTFEASFFLDATDTGDVLALANVEHRLGAEAQSETGEPHAPAVARPDWIQPITIPVALERRPDGEDHTIAKPADYERIKAEQAFTIVDGYIDSMFDVPKDMWSYRRFICAENFADPAFANDLTMLNVGSNDYQGGTIPTGDPAKDAAVIEAARQASLSFVYWLQTECPRSDSTTRFGYPELRPRDDAFGVPGGTAAAPYIRESRRIVALSTVVEQDVDVTHNPGPRAKAFADSCGIGFYGGLDIHGLKAVGMPQIFVNIKPFQIPLGALVPKRVTNVLPACKNIGVSHIANGAYRLHPVEWNVGESSALLAAFCIARKLTPQAAHANAANVRAYQRTLLAEGIPLFWWSDVPFEDPKLFVAANLLGLAGIISGYDDMSFRAGEPLDAQARADIETMVGRALPWPAPTSPATTLTRGAVATWLASELGLLA